jgi:hypothetical protein
MAEWIWAAVVGIAALLLGLSLIITPERITRWREQFWETDSDGDLPPRVEPPKMPWSKENVDGQS